MHFNYIIFLIWKDIKLVIIILGRIILIEISNIRQK